MLTTTASPAAADNKLLCTKQDVGPDYARHNPPQLLPSRWEAGAQMRFKEWTWIDRYSGKRLWAYELRNLGRGGGAHFYQGFDREQP